MTEEQSKDWFKNAEKFSPKHSIVGENFISTHYEDMYQAFKARVKSELKLELYKEE